jgi:hypothetical protein
MNENPYASPAEQCSGVPEAWRLVGRIALPAMSLLSSSVAVVAFVICAVFAIPGRSFELDILAATGNAVILFVSAAVIRQEIREHRGSPA